MNHVKQDQRIAALTKIEVLVIIAILGVLVAMLLPEFARQRARHDWGSCVVHLRWIGLEFGSWANDHGGKFPAKVSVSDGGTMELVSKGEVWPHFQVLSNGLNTPGLVWCPQDSGRTRAVAFGQFTDANVSYFVGVDAGIDRPNMLLAGDRNITVNGVPPSYGLTTLATNTVVAWSSGIHGKSGNLVFVDGHAEQGGAEVIRQALHRSGDTNRLAIP